MKFTKGHIINTIRCTITQGTRLCTVYCLGWGSQSFQGTSWSRGIRTTPGCPLTQETRIYMYLVYGWRSQPFSRFLIIFCFRGIRTTHEAYDLHTNWCAITQGTRYTLFRNRIPIVFRDIWSFSIPGGRMTSGAIYYFP